MPPRWWNSATDSVSPFLNEMLILSPMLGPPTALPTLWRPNAECDPVVRRGGLSVKRVVGPGGADQAGPALLSGPEDRVGLEPAGGLLEAVGRAMP
jgi:hypothetical protein